MAREQENRNWEDRDRARRAATRTTLVGVAVAGILSLWYFGQGGAGQVGDLTPAEAGLPDLPTVDPGPGEGYREFALTGGQAPAPLAEGRQLADPVRTKPRIQLRIYACPTIYDACLAELKRTFELREPGIAVEIRSRTDRDCVGHLLMDTGDIALISTEVSPNERAEGLQDAVFAYSISVPVVHPSNPVHTLEQLDLDRLIRGELTSWRGLGGPDVAIQPVCKRTPRIPDHAESFLRMKGEAEKIAILFDSPPEILAYVANQPAAVGLCELAEAVDNRGVRILQLSHAAPGRESFVRGVWTRGAALRTVVHGRPIPAVRTFLTFLTTNPATRLIQRRFALAK